MLKSEVELPTVLPGPEPRFPTSWSIEVMSSVIPAVLLVRVDSASLLRPKREVPLRPVVEARLPLSLVRRPPEAPRVAAPPRDLVEVVPPEVPRPVVLVATVRLTDVPVRVAEEPPVLLALLPPLET